MMMGRLPYQESGPVFRYGPDGFSQEKIMIILSKTFSVPQVIDTGRIAPLKDIAFVDIETTGLSASSSGIYLIGAAFHRQMEWHIRQWFADSLSAEQDILRDFFEFLKEFRVVVTYNGDSFDLPFLEHCAEQYSIPFSRESFESFDLYRKARPLKKLLSLENLKQSTIEEFLGIEREDHTSGKDMIPVYQSFLETRDETLYHDLLQHNESDIRSLPCMLALLKYLDIFSCSWNLAGHSLNTEDSLLTAVIDCEISVPVSFTYQTTVYTISIRANQIIIEMPVFCGELKYFFDHVSEYDYLPEEDRAVHHKVAQFVEKEFRQKATARNCYTRKTGVFLPMLQIDPMFDLFRESYESDLQYTEYQNDPEFLLAYFRLLLSGSSS